MTTWHLLVHKEVNQSAILQVSPPIRRRLNLVLRHLAIHGRTSIVKFVQGAAKGWRRTPLGGTGGSHYYLWWAPAGTPPVEHLTDLGRSFIAVRAVRHHDQTSELLEAGTYEQVGTSYRDVTLSELVGVDQSFVNEEQSRFVNDHSSVRLLMGHPGTGKTTTLQEGIFRMPGGTVLYVTFNRALAMAANDFLREASNVKTRVITVSQLLQLLTPGTLDIPEDPRAPLQEGPSRLYALLERWRWHKLLTKHSASDLYHELHATVFGKAVPDVSRPKQSAIPYLSEQEYRKLHPTRYPHLGDQLVKLAHRIVDEGEFEMMFPHHAVARESVAALLDDKRPIPRELLTDAMFIDEIQDLTLVEQTAIVLLAKRVAAETELPPTFVAAGDEAQVVRPSDFEWGPLSNLLSKHLGDPVRSALSGNVRNPDPIVRTINNTWSLYAQMEKTERPRGYAKADAVAPVGGGVFYVPCSDPTITAELIAWFSAEPGRRALYPDPLGQCPLDGVSTTVAEKGLDYQHIAVIDAGRLLSELSKKAKETHRGIVDGVRVAISRATETLLFVETRPTSEGHRHIRELCRGADCAVVTAQEVLQYLHTLDQDEQDLISLACDEAQKLLGSDPDRAWNQALVSSKRAQQLRISGHCDVGLDDVIAQTVTRCALIHPSTEKLNRSLDELKQPHLENIKRAVEMLVAVFGQVDPLKSLPHLQKLQEVLPSLPDWSMRISGALEAWSNKVLTNLERIVSGAEDWSKLARCLDAIGRENQNLLLARKARDVQETIAGRLYQSGAFANALAIWTHLGVRSKQVADCLGKLGRLTEAAEMYEQIDAPREAMNIWRALPNTKEAIRVAQAMSAPEAELLEQLQSLQEDLQKAGEHLLPVERELLATRLGTKMKRDERATRQRRR